MPQTIQLRRDSTANWTSANTILHAGEPGVELSTPAKFKIGDGTTHWNDLPYQGTGGAVDGGTPSDTGPEGIDGGPP
jgi:Major tropism determinant N-terminal domain